MSYSQLFTSSHNKRLVIGIPTIGCRWVRNSVGCVHCHAPIVMVLHKPCNSPLNLVKNEIIKWKNKKIDIVCLYSPGSVLDSSEISQIELEKIILEIKNYFNPQKIILEVRPELVNRNALIAIKNIAKEIIIEVCMPLESSNHQTRKLIGKTFSNNKFQKAVSCIKESGCVFSTTLVLKPPGLSEYEAIIDIRNSLSWLTELIPYRVIIEPIMVYEGTKLGELFFAEQYQPSWLWSIYAAMEFSSINSIEVGGEFFYPSPIAISHNCGNCSKIIENYLRHTNWGLIKSQGRNIELCQCVFDWLDEINDIKTSLRDLAVHF